MGYLSIRNEVNNLSVCYKTAPVARHQPGHSAGHQYTYSSVPLPLAPNRQEWLVVIIIMHVQVDVFECTLLPLRELGIDINLYQMYSALISSFLSLIKFEI